MWYFRPTHTSAAAATAPGSTGDRLKYYFYAHTIRRCLVARVSTRTDPTSYNNYNDNRNNIKHVNMLLFLLYYYFAGTNYLALQITVFAGDFKRTYIMERTVFYNMYI